MFLAGGCSAVGFVIAYAHLLMVAVVRVAACGEGGADPWLATTVTAVPAAAAMFLMPLGLFLRTGLRWCALPVFPLAALAVFVAAPFLEGTTIGGVAPCAVAHAEATPASATLWQRLWAPVQLALVVAVAFSAARFWRRGTAGRQRA